MVEVYQFSDVAERPYCILVVVLKKPAGKHCMCDALNTLLPETHSIQTTGSAGASIGLETGVALAGDCARLMSGKVLALLPSDRL